MRRMLKKIFNTNKGHFIKEHIYDFGGKPFIGYILCREYVMFGIPGYDRLGVYIDKADAEKELSDINKRENLFAGELTPGNIYRYYLEKTGDGKEAQELLDELIKEMDKLIKKGSK